MVPSPVSSRSGTGRSRRWGTCSSTPGCPASGGSPSPWGRGTASGSSAAVGPVLENADIFRVAAGSVDAALSLGEALRAGGYDALVGIGGGRTLDVGKYAAGMIGLPFVSVATTLTTTGWRPRWPRSSTTGASTPTASRCRWPSSSTSTTCAGAPAASSWAGIGDVVSNLNALADWRLAQTVNGEPVDGLAAAMAQTAAEAVLHHPGSPEDDDFLTTLAQGLVLSGLAMSVAGTSRPCSGSCHEICHAIDQDFPGRSTHGLQVAVGALFSSWLREDPAVGALDACLRRHGVPRLPADIGLTTEEFTRAVLDGPGTRPGRFTVLEQLDLGPDDARERVEEFVRQYA